MKSCFAFSVSLSFLLLILLSVYPQRSESAPLYLWHYCPNATLFAINSTYQSNLNALLSSLSSSAAAAAATNNAGGFANATAGQNPPDKAYGLFLCRGDVSATTCSDCVTTGKKDILQRCPNQRVSAIWYEECLLRYSNQSIFSVVEEVPALLLRNITGNITDPAKLVQVFGNTIKDVAWRASGKTFAIATADVTTLERLYTMAQCTPDLTPWDCNTCLRSVIPLLPEGHVGGMMCTPSCIVRFALHLFYNASVVPGPLPPPVTSAELAPVPPPHEGIWEM
ncbi:cysteine-rich receptor-like protein kinase 25 [Rhodamnia argentea]|uniref:Cysteine-rich receptor-like protein kinase 25 n=1 Tax=Rhodamnia argentea TaxID=178133 RepID=A0ABM3H6H9_9MYRT|nr:cysteine-rich receptor-like protein kinase 25 [Rhodamnia argentea]